MSDASLRSVKQKSWVGQYRSPVKLSRMPTSGATLSNLPLLRHKSSDVIVDNDTREAPVSLVSVE